MFLEHLIHCKTLILSSDEEWPFRGYRYANSDATLLVISIPSQSQNHAVFKCIKAKGSQTNWPEGIWFRVVRLVRINQKDNLRPSIDAILFCHKCYYAGCLRDLKLVSCNLISIELVREIYQIYGIMEIWKGENDVAVHSTFLTLTTSFLSTYLLY